MTAPVIPRRVKRCGVERVGVEHQLRDRREVGAAAQAVPTVDREQLAGHPTRLVGQEEADDVGDVLGLAHVAERRLVDVAVPHRATARDALHHLGRDEAGLHAVDPDVHAAVLVGCVPHHRLDAGLGHGIRTEVRVGDVPGDRRHADDRSAAGAGEVRHRVLDAEHRADDVEVQHAQELVDVDQVIRREATTTARVRDHAVERAAELDRRAHQAGHVGFDGHVGDHELDLAACTADRVGLLRQRPFGPPADRDPRALVGRDPSAGRADAGAAAGDDHGTTLEGPASHGALLATSGGTAARRRGGSLRR